MAFLSEMHGAAIFLGFNFYLFDWLVRRMKIWLVGLAGLLVGSI